MKEFFHLLKMETAAGEMLCYRLPEYPRPNTSTWQSDLAFHHNLIRNSFSLALPFWCSFVSKATRKWPKTRGVFNLGAHKEQEEKLVVSAQENVWNAKRDKLARFIF